jgi:hypothetical protein
MILGQTRGVSKGVYRGMALTGNMGMYIKIRHRELGLSEGRLSERNPGYVSS